MWNQTHQEHPVKINVVTLFDSNYAIRAMAFYESLKDLGKYKFWFLCLDQQARIIMEKLNLPDTTTATLEELGDKELLNTSGNRSRSEFIFTAKPAWINYVLSNIPDGEGIIFDDCDLFYFSSPNDLISDMEKMGQSIGIVPHHFPKNRESLNDKVGKYNAGLLYLIADRNSRLCVSEWRKQCIDWCYLKYEKGRFGDQLYLNEWPQKYNGVREINEKGVNLGSWSIYSYKITKRNNEFYVDENRLICYHFHRTKFYLSKGRVEPLPIYVYHKELYSVYTQRLENAWKKLLNLDKSWIYGFTEKPNILRYLKQKVERFFRNLFKI